MARKSESFMSCDIRLNEQQRNNESNLEDIATEFETTVVIEKRY